MLAAGSFSSPYEHLSQPETKRMVEHYTAYLSDNTRLIANPGLKVPEDKKPENTHAVHTEGRTECHLPLCEGSQSVIYRYKQLALQSSDTHSQRAVPASTRTPKHIVRLLTLGL